MSEVRWGFSANKQSGRVVIVDHAQSPPRVVDMGPDGYDVVEDWAKETIRDFFEWVENLTEQRDKRDERIRKLQEHVAFLGKAGADLEQQLASAKEDLERERRLSDALAERTFRVVDHDAPAELGIPAIYWKVTGETPPPSEIPYGKRGCGTYQGEALDLRDFARMTRETAEQAGRAWMHSSHNKDGLDTIDILYKDVNDQACVAKDVFHLSADGYKVPDYGEGAGTSDEDVPDREQVISGKPVPGAYKVRTEGERERDRCQDAALKLIRILGKDPSKVADSHLIAIGYELRKSLQAAGLLERV